jgi:Domain of unknown function (DUF3560)
MTRRERLERKIERRREWAESRQQKASAVLDNRPSYASDWAFITQPGHIPERARLNAAEDRAFEDLKMAQHHEAKADGLEKALEHTIFSDDSDAVEAIEARIAENEKKRERMRTVNALYRKGNAAGLKELGLDLESLRAQVGRLEAWQDQQPYAKYELANLGGRIQADRKRLEYVRGMNERKEEAAAAVNGVVIKQHQCGTESYTSVTFAEKPSREVLNALREAGYRWGNGQWFGLTAKLPESVASLAN